MGGIVDRDKHKNTAIKARPPHSPKTFVFGGWGGHPERGLFFRKRSNVLEKGQTSKSLINCVRFFKNFKNMITNFGQYLGLYLAEELNDKKHTGFYLKLAKQYDSDDLLSVLSMTKDICRRKPVKNKAALFTKLFFEYIK